MQWKLFESFVIINLKGLNSRNSSKRHARIKQEANPWVNQIFIHEINVLSRIKQCFVHNVQILIIL